MREMSLKQEGGELERIVSSTEGVRLKKRIYRSNHKMSLVLGTKTTD